MLQIFEKIFKIYPYSYHFWCPSFLNVDSDSHLVLLSSCSNHFLWHLLYYSPAGDKCLGFHISEEVSFHLHFQETLFFTSFFCSFFSNYNYIWGCLNLFFTDSLFNFVVLFVSDSFWKVSILMSLGLLIFSTVNPI